MQGLEDYGLDGSPDDMISFIASLFKNKKLPKYWNEEEVTTEKGWKLPNYARDLSNIGEYTQYEYYFLIFFPLGGQQKLFKQLEKKLFQFFPPAVTPAGGLLQYLDTNAYGVTDVSF